MKTNILEREELAIVSCAEFAQKLNLKTVFDGSGSLTLTADEINRPGLQLAGYFDHFVPERIQVIGNAENTFMKYLPEKIKIKVLDQYFSKQFPCLIVCRDLEIDDYIIRLTQKARAAGIHVIIGTQRPSVDVITGVIKSNIPSRIAFRVPALVDSRTILDEAGAEKLVARGDMLLKPVGALKPTRVQGAFISEEECERITTFLRENSSENYDESIVSQIESNATKLQKAEKRNDEDGEGGGSDLDDKFYAALEIAVDSGKISSSYLQRKLNLGFQRAARIIDTMEELGYIGEPNGSKPRDVLITKQDFLELMMKRNEDDE